MTVQFERIDAFSDDGVVEFYTVRLDDNRLTEFELFIEKDFPDHLEEIRILYAAIRRIQWRGAHPSLFKFEENADALPKVPDEVKILNEDDWGVRLYCIRVNEGLVILLNGDIKTEEDPNKCPNVKHHFNRARKIGTVLNREIAERTIKIKEERALDKNTIYI